MLIGSNGQKQGLVAFSVALESAKLRTLKRPPKDNQYSLSSQHNKKFSFGDSSRWNRLIFEDRSHGKLVRVSEKKSRVAEQYQVRR